MAFFQCGVFDDSDSLHVVDIDAVDDVDVVEVDITEAREDVGFGGEAMAFLVYVG